MKSPNVGAHRPGVMHAGRPHLQFENASEIELNTALEKLRIPLKIESIEAAVPIIRLETQVTREIPVHLRGDSAKGASLHIFVIKIAPRVPNYKFPRPRAAIKNRAFGLDVSKVTSDRVVSARSIVEEVCSCEFAAVELRIALSIRRNKYPPVFATEKPPLPTVKGFVSDHTGRIGRE